VVREKERKTRQKKINYSLLFFFLFFFRSLTFVFIFVGTLPGWFFCSCFLQALLATKSWFTITSQSNGRNVFARDF